MKLFFAFLFVSSAFGWVNVAHYLGETTIGGPYMLTTQALENNYNGVTADNFGTTTVVLPGTEVHPLVRDMQYPVGDGVGYTPIPVQDNVPEGSATMDEFLRKQMKLKSTDQIFGLIVYLHPEEHTGNLKQLATEYVKTEAGMTHLGAYVGGGATLNSPEDYHSKKWGIMSGNMGYPATVQIVKFRGVEQSTLNRNMFITMSLLNKGVKFPSDYKNDVYKTIDLATTLQFYKDWLKDESYLRTDDKWKTYCAEHVTITVNVGLNIPQSLKGYTDAYGETEGQELYEIARTKYRAIVGDEVFEQTWGKPVKFRALWKRRGVRAPLEEREVGNALAWPPQTNSDIMVNFLENYASWPQVGAHVFTATAFGFKETLTERMADNAEGVAHIGENFDKLVGKAAVLAFVAEAMTVPNIEPEVYFKTKKVHLYAAFGGDPANILDQDPRWKLAGLIMDQIKPYHAKIAGAPTMTKQDAYKFYRKELYPVIEAGRQIAILESDLATTDEKLVRFNSPPAVTHRVAIGQHPSDKDVEIIEVATAINKPHLRVKTAAERAANVGAEPRVERGCQEGSTALNCLSYRQIQLECMERQLNPCNVRKALLMQRVAEDRQRTRR